MIKTSLILFLFFLPLISISQDYYINLDGEKIECAVIGNNYRTLIVEVNGEKVKFRADEVLEFNSGGIKHYTGKVPYASYGVPIWCFLVAVEDGEMSLCKISTNYLSDDPVSGNTNTNTATVHFVRRTNTPLDEYTKIGIKWKKDLAALGSDCEAFQSKVKKTPYDRWSWEEELVSLVRFYNETCN